VANVQLVNTTTRKVAFDGINATEQYVGANFELLAQTADIIPDQTQMESAQRCGFDMMNKGHLEVAAMVM